MKFNSQICTSREQSERLLALGLMKETADMCWIEEWGYDDDKQETFCTGNYFVRPIDYVWDDKYINYIPAWSMGRLWELYWSNKVVSDCLFGCGKYMNPYAEMIAMIEYDIEDGTFNKDYLDK